MVKAGERYRHFKGNEYEIIAIARDSDDLKEVVVYRGLYGSLEFGDNPVWVRPLSEFYQKIEREGKKINRFELLK